MRFQFTAGVLSISIWNVCSKMRYRSLVVGCNQIRVVALSLFAVRTTMIAKDHTRECFTVVMSHHVLGWIWSNVEDLVSSPSRNLNISTETGLKRYVVGQLVNVKTLLRLELRSSVHHGLSLQWWDYEKARLLRNVANCSSSQISLGTLETWKAKENYKMNGSN